MARHYKINCWDLNLILTIIGFPFFTMLISNSAASIAYRGFALLVALICLQKAGIRFVPASPVRNFLIVLLYVSIQSLLGIFFGEYASYPYEEVKYMYLLFNVGVLWFPLLAFISGFDRIQWDKALKIIFVLLLVTIIHADLQTFDAEVAADGRFDMGRLSTLTFGDNAAYLILMATTLLVTRRSWLTKWKTMVVCILVFAILAGFFGMLKAGSRGPVVGFITGFLFLAYCMKGKDRRWLVVSFVVMGACGAVSLSKLQDFAPAMYDRFILTFEEHDMSGRGELFAEAFAKFQDNPLFGVNPILLEPTQYTSCHNVYLETLEGGGIIIFMLFLYSLLAIIFGAAKCRDFLGTHPGYLFLFALFFFNMGRGISGIILTTTPIYAFPFVGCGIVLYYIKRNGYIGSNGIENK